MIDHVGHVALASTEDKYERTQVTSNFFEANNNISSHLASMGSGSTTS